MSLENILVELGNKLEANTAAHKSLEYAIEKYGVGKAPPVSAAASRDPKDDDPVTTAVADKSAPGRGRGRPPKDAAAKTYTADDVAAAAGKVKEELGVDKAKALIGEYAAPGKKLAEIPEKKYGAFITAAEALINAAAQADEDPDADDGL